jgi:hypothetical protein
VWWHGLSYIVSWCLIHSRKIVIFRSTFYVIPHFSVRAKEIYVIISISANLSYFDENSKFSWKFHQICTIITNSMKQSNCEAKSHSAGQEIFRFYGTWNFITVFTKLLHWTVFWATWISLHSKLYYFKVHFNYILPPKARSSNIFSNTAMKIIIPVKSKG